MAVKLTVLAQTHKGVGHCKISKVSHTDIVGSGCASSIAIVLLKLVPDVTGFIFMGSSGKIYRV